MSWTPPIPEQLVSTNYGFVYLIINKTKNKFYVGKKQFRNKKSMKPLKNKKNKRIKYAESDWKTYNGSNKELLKDIRKGDEIKKLVIALCDSAWMLKYQEAKTIINLDCLSRDDCYNGILQIKLGRSPKKK